MFLNILYDFSLIKGTLDGILGDQHVTSGMSDLQFGKKI